MYVEEQKPGKQHIDYNKFLETGLCLFSFFHFFLLGANLFFFYSSYQGEVVVRDPSSPCWDWKKMLGAGLEPSWGTSPCRDLCSDLSEQKPAFCDMANTANSRTSQKPTPASWPLQKSLYTLKLNITLVNACVCLVLHSSATPFIHMYFECLMCT